MITNIYVAFQKYYLFGVLLCVIVYNIKAIFNTSDYSMLLCIILSMNGVGAHGDLCIATILPPLVIYSASSPVPLTKYSILHDVFSS
jgi:hypothetical protein